MPVWGTQSFKTFASISDDRHWHTIDYKYEKHMSIVSMRISPLFFSYRSSKAIGFWEEF